MIVNPYLKRPTEERSENKVVCDNGIFDTLLHFLSLYKLKYPYNSFYMCMFNWHHAYGT